MAMSSGDSNELGNAGARIGRGIRHRLVPIWPAWRGDIGDHCSSSNGNTEIQIIGEIMAQLRPAVFSWNLFPSRLGDSLPFIRWNEYITQVV